MRCKYLTKSTKKSYSERVFKGYQPETRSIMLVKTGGKWGAPETNLLKALKKALKGKNGHESVHLYMEAKKIHRNL